MDLVKVLSEQQLKSDLPELKIGDTVKVHAKIKEGNRERIQVFEGIIIAKKHAGVNQTVTVRRISYGVGVEKTFPLRQAVLPARPRGQGCQGCREGLRTTKYKNGERHAPRFCISGGWSSVCGAG